MQKSTEAGRFSQCNSRKEQRQVAGIRLVEARDGSNAGSLCPQRAARLARRLGAFLSSNPSTAWTHNVARSKLTSSIRRSTASLQRKPCRYIIRKSRLSRVPFLPALAASRKVFISVEIEEVLPSMRISNATLHITRHGKLTHWLGFLRVLGGRNRPLSTKLR